MNARNMLESVLNNEAPFFFCEQNEFRYLYEVDSAGENQFDYPLTPVSYTRVNMDQSKDGIVEMLVQMESKMNGWVLVLYEEKRFFPQIKSPLHRSLRHLRALRHFG